MSRYLSSSQRRKRSQDRLGLALLGAVALGFVGFGYAAVKIDESNGITPSESMCNNGFAGFCQAAPKEAPAVPAMLIGRCNGVLMAAMEESAFPAGCTWIEPIREFEAGRAGVDHSHAEGGR